MSSLWYPRLLLASCKYGMCAQSKQAPGPAPPGSLAEALDVSEIAEASAVGDIDGLRPLVDQECDGLVISQQRDGIYHDVWL